MYRLTKSEAENALKDGPKTPRFAEAYNRIFGITLTDRLSTLRQEYDSTTLGLSFEQGGLCWELSKYDLTPDDIAKEGKA